MRLNSESNGVRRSVVPLWIVSAVLVAGASLTSSCSWFGVTSHCDHEVHIRDGQGAEGMVPGTVRAHRGEKICFTNDTNVQRTVSFTNSPDEPGPSPKDLVLAPGETKHMKVHPTKPLGTYECEIVPPARSDGLWPPTEPQVVVE